MTKNINNLLHIKIKGITWKIYVQAPSVYARKHGSTTHAIVYPEDREAYFQKKFIKLGLIRHELIHMLVESSSTGRMIKTTPDDREEHIAGLMEDHFYEIGKIAEDIQEFIMKKKESK